MYRSFPFLIASVFGSLLLASHAAAQLFDEPAPATPAPPQAPSAANPAQPAQPPAVQPRQGQIQLYAPPGGQISSGGSVILQGGGGGGRGARAVIGGPGRLPGGGGGFIQGGINPPTMSFGMGPGHDDPEMAKLTQAEHELEQQSHDLIRKYSETEDQQVRDKAKSALREMLDKQFELQNQRRELELRRVEERLANLRGQHKKRNHARDQIVGQRLEQLVNEAEGLGWTSPAGGGPGVGFSFAPGGPGPRPAPAVGR